MRPAVKKTIWAALALTALVLAGLGGAFFFSRSYMAPSCGMHNCHCCGSPFGGYCTGGGRGWYGSDKAVKTAKKAGELIAGFYLPAKDRAANITDKGGFFEAEVKNARGKTVDIVIVDKRTGRIRSIY